MVDPVGDVRLTRHANWRSQLDQGATLGTNPLLTGCHHRYVHRSNLVGQVTVTACDAPPRAFPVRPRTVA
jgi:hypothetical protein